MATFGHIVYACLDLLKSRSDDAYYTEEHILFLASKMRAYLIEKKYRVGRNGVYVPIADENKQQICLPLEPATMLPGNCGGGWLQSKDTIPAFLSISDSVAFAANDLLDTNIAFIPRERMPYVGYNKWLKNIIYAALSNDRRLYLKGNNPQFLHLEKVGLNGVFEDAEAAAMLSEEACENGGKCDILSQRFPLEASLVDLCIEMVVRELTGAKYASEDKQNNAKDDLGIASGVRNDTPVAKTEREA